MTKESSDDHPTQAAPAGWQRWLARVAALFIVCWLGWYAYQRVVFEPNPRTEYWQAQIDQLQPRATDAMPLDELALILSARPWEPNPTTRPAGFQQTHYDEIAILQYGPWDAKDRPDHDLYIDLLTSSEVQALRSQLIDAVHRPWPFQCPLGMVTMPRGVSPNSWTKFLLSHSRYAIEEQSARARAVEDWLTLYRMSLQYCALRHSLYQIYGTTLQSSLATELLYLPNEMDGPWPMDPLANLVLGQPAVFDKPSELLAADRIQVRADLDKYFVGKAGWMDVAKYVRDMAPTRPATRWWNLTSPIFYSRDELRVQQDAFWDELDKATCLADVWVFEQAQEHHEVANLWGNASRKSLRPDPCAAEIHWSWKNVPLFALRRIYQPRIRLEAAVTCLALENYRIDLGTFPETLDELVPTYLPRVPVDYVTMQPLRYRRDHQFYQLYSVGFDGKDDGGRGSLEGTPRRDLWQQTGYDMVFSDRDRPGLDRR